MPLLSYSSDEPEAPATGLTPEGNTGGLLSYSGDAFNTARDTESGYTAAGGKSTWADVGHQVMSGVYGQAAAGASLLASRGHTPEETRYWQEQADAQRAAAKESVGAETSTAKADREGSFLAHPVLQGAEQAPGIVVAAVPSVVAGAALGPVAGATVASAIMGEQERGQAVDDYTQQVMATPADTLMKNPQYKELIASGMSEDEAKRKFAHDTSGNLALQSEALGAITGAISPYAEFAGLGANKLLGDTLVRRVLAGGLEAGASMGAQAGGQTYLTGQAGAESGIRGPVTAEEIERSALEGFAAGAGLGAVAGVSGHPTRSGKADARKPEARPGYVATAESDLVPESDASIKGTGPATPPSPIDETQTAALNPKPITPEGKPQPEVVTQPQVVQPEVPNVSRSTEGQPVGDTTEPLYPPQKVAEASPAPVPAPAITVPEVRQPEPRASLEEQHAALLDPEDPREAMLYDKGQQPIEIVDKKNFGQVRLRDGSIVQYDKNGPSGFTPNKIRQYAKDDRLNEALQLGPVTKDEAASRVAAGERGAVVTERTPDHTEVKASSGTTATVPDQIAALEAAKAPENSINVESAEGVLADRQSRIAQEQTVQPPVVSVTPEGKLPAPSTRRILEAQGEKEQIARNLAAEQDARQAATVAEQLKAKELAKQEKAKVSHKAKTDQLKTAGDNVKARKIIEAHPAPPVLDNVKRPTVVYNRAEAMVKAAKDAGIDIPKTFPEGHAHNGAMLKLREAADLVAIKNPKWDAYARFLDREKLIDAKREKEAFAARQNEGAKELGSPEGATEEQVIPKSELGTFIKDARHPENELIEKQESGATHEDALEHEEHPHVDIKREETPEEFRARRDAAEAGVGHDPWDTPANATRGAILKKIEAAKAIARDENIGREERDNAQRGVERLQAALTNNRPERVDALAAAREEREAKIAKAREESEALRKEPPAAPKAAMGFQVAKKGRFAIKRSEIEEGRLKSLLRTDDDGNPVEVKPQHSETIKDMLTHAFDIKHYAAEMRPMMERLHDAIVRLAGDTPVHYIKHEDMMAMGHPAYGLYDRAHNEVMMNDNYNRYDTAIHEAFHAATSRALKESPELKAQMNALRREAAKQAPPAWGVKDSDLKDVFKYAFSDPEEFLTHLMTNKDFQGFLKNVKISDALARDIGIPKWRKATMWEGAMTIIRRALGLGPRDTSAIEAAMAISEKAMWSHDPGMAMEAAGRMARNDRLYQRMEPAERHQDAFLKSASEHVKTIAKIDADVAKQAFKDAKDNTKVGFVGKTAKILSGTQLADIHKKLFTDAKGNIISAITDARAKVGHLYNELRTKDRDVINRGHILDRTHAGNMGDYAELVNMSARYNIHADQAPPKTPKNLVKAARKDWQRNQFDAKAREIYNRLPEDLQKRYREEKKFYRDKQKELAETVLDKTLPILDLDKDMEARARKNELTAEDWDKLREMGADKPIEAAHRLINKQDVYFAGDRGGDHMFTGKYEMPKGGKDVFKDGEKVDNQRDFDTEEAAHEYVTSTHLPSQVKEVGYVKDANGKLADTYPKSAETDKAGLTGKPVRLTDATDTKFRVELERQHTEFHERHSDAVKARAEAEKAGVGELSQVMDRRDDKSWSSIGGGDQAALEKRIKNRDNLSTAEKEHLIQSTRMLVLGRQGGMAPHLMASRKVGGARYNGMALDNYSRAINNHIARNAHSTELNQAMSRLDEHENANRSGEGATTRSIIGNEMRDRVYKDPNVGASKASPLMHKLMTLSFINFLVRPSHIFLSQVHPYVYSVPMMASRHGYWKSVQAQRLAMKDLGGQMANLKRGAASGRDMARSLREKNIDKAVELAHGGDPIHEMINRLSDKNERAALMSMYETGHLHSAYDTSMFSGGGLDRANATMAQFTNAMEANNRLSTALASYRLEKSQHGDAAAKMYARRVIEETHGVYSAGNIAPIFKNPLLRATLQFHQQPMNLAIKLYHNLGKAAKGDREAMGTLAYQLGTAALLGGMGGMPMDLPKLAGVASATLGGDGPDDYMDKFRRTLADNIGPEATNVIMEGLPALMGPLGPSLGHRMGFDAGLLSDSSKSGKGSDVLGWAAKNVVGAPGSVIMQWLDGLHALEGGDYQKAGESFMPGSLRDFAKAYRLGTSGVQAGGKTVREGSYGDALLQTLGFSGVERERQMEGHFAMKKATDEAAAEKKLTKGEQLKAKQRERAAKSKPSVFGTPITKDNKTIAREYRNVYQ